MRSWSLHVVFAIILVGSLTAKARTTDVLSEDGNLEAAVIRVAGSHGLMFREYAPIASTGDRALVFDAPSCSRPILVNLLKVTFDEEALIVTSAREQADVLRYVYIDRTWDKPERLAVFVERMKYAALATFGLTRFTPSWHLLLTRSPSHCHDAAAIDWRPVWNREYR